MSEKRIVATDRAPAAIGPYSQGVIAAGKLLFVAGQIALDPATGELTGGDIEAQTRRALENLRGILEAAGSSLDRVVKTTVFLRDLRDFPRMNRVYAEYFNLNPPARSTVQVAALPKDALVEIEAVALVD
jgi:2-iminobutanoate/2-iminopropanoate deaminase